MPGFSVAALQLGLSLTSLNWKIPEKTRHPDLNPERSEEKRGNPLKPKAMNPKSMNTKPMNLKLMNAKAINPKAMSPNP